MIKQTRGIQQLEKELILTDEGLKVMVGITYHLTTKPGWTIDTTTDVSWGYARKKLKEAGIPHEMDNDVLWEAYQRRHLMAKTNRESRSQMPSLYIQGYLEDLNN